MTDEQRPALLLRGLDTLEVSFYLQVRNSKLDFVTLEENQQRAKEARRDRFIEMELGTEKFALLPYGRHPYSYVLSNEQFEIRLGEFMQPPCLVRFSSRGLWLHGIDALVERFDAWCESMGLVASAGEVVSRADWAFDYHLPAIDFTSGNFVTRAEKDAQWRQNGAVQTFQLGRSQVVIRLYDKVAEIAQQSEKTFLFQLWGRASEVWRIEFQIRGDRLKEAGIRTLEDLRTLQNDLLREVASNHTTLRRPSEDSNRSRWPLHPLWRALQHDIDTLPQTGLVRHIDRQAPHELRLYFQSKAVYGYLKGIAALMVATGELRPDPRLGEVLASLGDLMREHHQPDLWRGDVQGKLKALELGQW